MVIPSPLAVPPPTAAGPINLQTLNATIQQAVQAQNLIATNIAAAATKIAAAFPVLYSSKTWDPPSLTAGATETTTVTVAGAALGMPAQCAFSLDLQAQIMTAYVSAANTVTVVLYNVTSGTINLSSGTLTVAVFGAV